MNEKSPYKIEIIQKKAQYHPDPTIVFNHLCKNKKSTLLLETAEINKKNDIESIMIIDSAIRISAKDNIVRIETLSINGKNILLILKTILPNNIQFFSKKNILNLVFPHIEENIDEDNKLFELSIFDTFRLIINIFNNEQKISKAMFFGGLFSYDLITNFESIPKLKRTQKCPDFCFYLAETILVLDHQKKTALIQNSLFSDHQSEKIRMKQRSEEIERKLNQEIISIPVTSVKNMELTSNMNNHQYCSIISKLQKLIQKGEIFQVVPSRKFYLSCPNPLASYQKLKKAIPVLICFSCKIKISHYLVHLQKAH